MAGFFWERANLREFEHKITMRVKKSDKYQDTKE